MKVRLERSGGFANIRRAVTVDATGLVPERAEELRRLVQAADLAALPENAASHRGSADQFVYRLTVEDNAGPRSVTVREDAAPEPVRRLIDWLQTTAAG